MEHGDDLFLSQELKVSVNNSACVFLITDHHRQPTINNDSSEIEHSDAGQLGKGIGQQQLNVPQINREQLGKFYF